MNERFWWLWMVLPAAVGQGIILLIAFLHVRSDTEMFRWKKLPSRLRLALWTPCLLASVLWILLCVGWYVRLQFFPLWPAETNLLHKFLLSVVAIILPHILWQKMDTLVRRWLGFNKMFPRPGGSWSDPHSPISNDISHNESAQNHSL